ncbi:MAG TPA: hypothetical protein VLT82_01890, partial [Myxococcaceae bacterium]|nr:hypothetical protein [Myxococcaceae bacterium]
MRPVEFGSRGGPAAARKRDGWDRRRLGHPFELEPVDTGSEEVVGEVSIDLLGQLWVSVSEHLLNDDQGHLLAEKQSRRRVTEVVEPNGPDDRLGPEPHVALAAAPEGGVRSGLLVPTAPPTAHVLPSAHDARATERPTENCLERHLSRKHAARTGAALLGATGAADMGKNELGGGLLKGVAQPGHEGCGDGHRVGVTALRGLAVPAASDNQEPSLEVYVLAPKRGELTLSKPRVDGRGVQRPPSRVQLSEHPGDLLDPQMIPDRGLRNLPLPNERDGVGARPAPDADCRGKRSGEKGPKV